MSSPTDIAEMALPAAGASTAAADACTIVIFGASGDLAKRKLIPALYELASHKSLARRFAIIGFARTAMSDDAFRGIAEDALRKHAKPGQLDDSAMREFL